ncbi:recombinase family protein [Kitasatospora sp. NPDC058243]|uniref:recombinase family protein n=1 Tax=Kitasatospora sp. NPDC058243 TaxID=3346397 RepID=UPI0036DE7480
MTSADDAFATDYDGCGMCLVGVRRLSRVKKATSSPARQRDLILAAVAEVGGHIIAWADDWEVSGATDPMSRPKFGPWLRDEMGPYDGIAASAVDRIGRNVVDTLNTAYKNRDAGRKLVTADHRGLWDLDDPNQENELTLKAMGAQMEHRSIRERNRQETKRARAAGQVANRPSYGFRYVRAIPGGKVTSVETDVEDSAKYAREAARRILADRTGKITPHTEAARLTRARVLSPADWRAVTYGREPKGSPWSGKGLAAILTSEAALGYLMHGGRPVVGDDGKPVRLPGNPEPLWDRTTHLALVEKCAPSGTGSRAPKGVVLLSDLGDCGQCGERLYVAGQSTYEGKKVPAYHCTGRERGLPQSQHCKPSPTIAVPALDKHVTTVFLNTVGPATLRERVFDPGNGKAARVADLTAARTRLRADREAGLYESEADTAWFRSRYAELGRELTKVEAEPDRPAGWYWEETGRSVSHEWDAAQDDAERRHILESYGAKVTLYPANATERIVVTFDLPEEFDAHDGLDSDPELLVAA